MIAAERLVTDTMAAVGAVVGLAFLAWLLAPRALSWWDSIRHAGPAINRRRAAAQRWLRKYGRLRKAGLPRLGAALAVGDGTEPDELGFIRQQLNVEETT